MHDRAFPLFDASGELTLITGIAEDITARKAAEERLLFLAHYDNLTGLPNRPLFYDRLQHAAGALPSQQPRGSGGVRRPRPLQSRERHARSRSRRPPPAAGGAAAQADAARGRHVCRLGGDEFAVILSDLAQRRRCRAGRTEADARCSSSRSSSKDARSSSPPAPASRCFPATAKTPTRCSRMPTPRCIAPRKWAAPAISSTAPR